MVTKLFITGATGYIGGDALSIIIEQHPNWDITCLVRNSDKGAKIAAKYANIHLVYGDLDSIDLIEEETSKVDIVYHFANCDHEPSARAITRGLARRTSTAPAFWIHTSGTAILSFETISKNLYGTRTTKIYNDWDDVSELTSFPHESPHRNVDEIVLEAPVSHPNIKVAIVCPPTIYGKGRGPDNQRSIQAYRATELFLKNQQAVKIAEGNNVWHQVHIHDLSQLYLLLGEAAANGGPPATWNDQGYYLAENGEFVWGEILQEIASCACREGFLPSADVKAMSVEEAKTMSDGRPLERIIGTNSRGLSLRGRKLLGWKPRERSLKDEIPTIVREEARRAGLVKSHAEKVEVH